MINAFIASDTFENKGYWLRKRVPWFSRRYDAHYGIDQLEPGTPRHQQASAALEHLRAVCECQTSGHQASEEQQGVEKIIWMYWHAPLQEAPEVVQLSVASWQRQNPDHEVRLLNADNLEQVLGVDLMAAFELSTVRLSMAMKTDVLRLYLLSCFGGIWADATTFCLAPLETWLPGATARHGVFTFRQHKAPSRPVEAWFIAARQGSPVVTRVLALFVEHLFQPRQTAVFVSNRAKNHAKLGIGRQHPTLLYADFVRDAERHGFMPYFSVGYFFNESLRQHYTPSLIEAFMALDNRFASNGAPFEVFETAVVSKQTYKRDYEHRELFKARKAHLLALLERHPEAAPEAAEI